MRLIGLRVAVFAAVLGVAATVPARAAVLTGNAAIQFDGDLGAGALTYSDVVTVGAGPEVTFFDGSAIGDNVLLDFESLDLGGLTITYRIQGGGAPIAGHPGYRDNGMTSGAFTYAGLVFAPATSILGIAVSLTDVIDPLNAAGGFSFTANSLTMSNLQQFGILESTQNTGLITVRLITGELPPPVPEPATLVLLGIGLVAAARRLSRRG